MITPEYIKKLVEINFHIEDIGIKLRTTNIHEARVVYYRLCRDFCNKKLFTLSRVGKGVNKAHDSTIYGLKCFEDLKGQSCFSESLTIYNFLSAKISLDPKIIKGIEYMDENELRNYYRVKHIIFADKSKSVINSLKEKLEVFRNQTLNKVT